MPAFKRLPPSLRYFKARLRPLAQPLLWGSVLVVSLGMFALWELSVNPDWLSADGDEPIGESSADGSNALSAEDSAIAADIDTSPVLAEQLNRSNELSSLLNAPVIHNQGLFDEFRTRRLNVAQPAAARLLKPETPQPTPGPESLLNPDPTSNSLLNLNATGGSEPLSEFAPASREQQPLAGGAGLSAPLNGRNPVSPNYSSAPANPLKAAMEQYLNANAAATVEKQPAAKGTEALASPALFQTAGQGPESLNPAPTAQSSGLAASFPPAAFVPPELPSGVGQNNPYQTKLSNSGLTPAPALVPRRSAPTAPNNDLQQLLVPASNQGSADLSPGSLPNSGNSGFPAAPQPNPSNFLVAPLAQNQDASAAEANQLLSAPSPPLDRYAGTRELAPSPNP